MPRRNKIVPKRVICTNPKQNKIAGGNDCKRVWGIADSLTKETAMNKETTVQKGSHTPGPWRTDDHGIEVNIESDNGDLLATAYANDEIVRRIGLANARLISAAPDLLAVLKQVFEDWDNEGDYSEETNAEHRRANMEDAQAAIAKAEGATTPGRDA